MDTPRGLASVLGSLGGQLSGRQKSASFVKHKRRTWTASRVVSRGSRVPAFPAMRTTSPRLRWQGRESAEVSVRLRDSMPLPTTQLIRRFASLVAFRFLVSGLRKTLHLSRRLQDSGAALSQDARDKGLVHSHWLRPCAAVQRKEARGCCVLGATCDTVGVHWFALELEEEA